MAWISWSRTWATRRTTTTSRKPLRWNSMSLRWRRMYLLLRADQRLKQNHERRTSACSSTRTVPICERSWTDIEPENLFAYRLPCVKMTEYSSSSWWSTSRRRWSDWILEIKRLSSERIWKFSMNCGRVEWQEAEATRKYFNVVLIHEDNKFFISELFKVIQDAIPSILHYRTMY